MKVWIVACLCIQYVTAMHPDRSKRLTMLNENGRSKQRIINANDLSNVFTNKVTPTRRNEIQFSYTDEEESNLYNDEDDDDDDSTAADKESPKLNKEPPTLSTPSFSSNSNDNDNDNNDNDSIDNNNDLRSRSNSFDTGSNNNKVFNNDFTASGTVDYSRTDSTVDSVSESELGEEYDSFMNLDGTLGKVG